MKTDFRRFFFGSLVIVVAACSTRGTVDVSTEASDPLPSWNGGATKEAILDFVERTTTEDSEDFIPVEDRIACFDNDGNLWSEQPLYFQLIFAIDRIKELAPDHPEWAEEFPYKEILEGNIPAALAGGEHAILELVMATHGEMSVEEFTSTVGEWLAKAKHPRTGRAFNEMIYQPMVELLSYLRANGYKTFIVSGGGIDFMRVWTEAAYGIPPDQVVGSSVKVQYEEIDGVPTIMRLPELNFIDDKEGKPVGIHQYIGRRPVIASGNSDGDYQMLRWTTSRTDYPSLGLLLHHTDSVREWAYDRNSSIGRLSKGLDDADTYRWQVIDMQNDWAVVFPFEMEE